MIQLEIEVEELHSVLTLCNSLQCATVSLSLDLYITQVNPLAELLFVHPANQLINKPFQDICDKLSIISPIAAKATPETLIQRSIQTTHWLSNNTLVDVDWHVSRCINEGIYTGYLLVGKVIQRFVSDQLPVQMDKVIKMLPCTIFSKDTQGYCLSANQYQATIAGFSNEKDMIGKTIHDMPWFALEPTIIQKADELAIVENRTIIIEEYATNSRGEREVFLVTKSPYKDEEGRLLGLIGTALNITQHRQLLLLHSDIKPNQDLSTIYLSKKEIECINWMVKGKSSAEIATILDV